MKKINSDSIKLAKFPSETLKMYYQEIRKIKLIPKNEELELFIEYRKNKCPKIKNLLINNNLRFVLNISKHYQNSNFYEIGDVISSGNIGLIRAIEDFDPHKGFKFSTYAVWWIRQSILDSIIKESKIIKQPIKQHLINKKFLDLKNDFYNKYGFEANVEDVYDDLNLTTANNIIAKSISAINENNIISLNTKLDKNNDLTFEDTISSSLMDEDKILFNVDAKKITFNKLNKIQKLIISYTYGFNDIPELSFKEISKIIKISEREIRNIHNSTIKKLINDL
jgi:RNA polymerase primary sigma factor